MKLLSALALAAAATLATATGGHAAEDITLKVKEKQGIGPYLAEEDEERPIYMFRKDRPGTGTESAESRCDSACARSWPPVVDEDEPKLGKGLDPDLLGRTQREDGQHQVTYGGWPLYFYVKDHRGGGTTVGQHVEDFGAKWHLVAPDGKPIESGR